MNTQQLMSTLRERGYKVTPQRLAICELTLSSKDHPTADQIHKEIAKKYPAISLATIYQTLHLLKDIGLLQELGFGEGSSRYDPNTAPHINIICVKCGEICDYKAKNVKKLWAQIVGDLGFESTGQRLDIYRYCEKCTKQIASGKPAAAKL